MGRFGSCGIQVSNSYVNLGTIPPRSLVSIGKAAKLKGVSVTTLRRWEQKGRLIPERTPSGHRRYNLNHLLGIPEPENEPPQPFMAGRYTIGYARVSGHRQKGDLEVQKQVLEAVCIQGGWQFEIIEDVGSGLNYSKRGLKRLIKLICDRRIERLVLTHRDRLLRFGSELIFDLCDQFGTEVLIINKDEEITPEEDLVQSVLEIMTVFTARLYGSRKNKNKQMLTELRAVIEEPSLTVAEFEELTLLCRSSILTPSTVQTPS